MGKELSLEGFLSDDVERIAELSSTNVFACYQCGNCSGGCPAADYMELLPHHVIRLIQLGKIEEILESNTPWICAACITCSVRCPKGVDIAAVMEALRQLVLRKNLQRIDINRIARKDLSELPQIALLNYFRKLTL
jgi:heterodisulfide reductase subunit C